jgi:ubiquinone/menaquinone biosynthesis C-methylase UbiE
MKTNISLQNPFGYSRYGFLWEKLNERPRGNHLDYGTFDASILKKLLETGVIEKGYGVDLNQDAISRASGNLPDRISLKIIEKNSKLPFEDETFDSISILDVLEHIYDQKRVLMELFRVLKSNGLLIVTVPQKHVFSFLDVGNFKFLFPRIHKIAYEFKYSKQEYQRRYVICEDGLFGDIEIEKKWHEHFSKNALKLLLTNCGFKEIQFDGSGLFQRPLFLIRFMLPFMKNVLNKMTYLDAKKFERMNLFCTAVKK